MKKTQKHTLSQPQIASSNALYVPPKLFLLSVKKGEAQMLLHQQFAMSKMQTDFNTDPSLSSSKVDTKYYTQGCSTGTYWRDTGTNNSTTTSGLNQHKLDISFGKEPKHENSQISESCDMRMARLRQKQQNTLKELFQKTVSSLDQKLSVHRSRKESEQSQESIQTRCNMLSENKSVEEVSVNKDNHGPQKERYYSQNRQEMYSKNMDQQQQQQQSDQYTENQYGQEVSNLKQNQSHVHTEIEPKSEKTLKDIINHNKSISLLSQSLKNRMQELEDKYLKSENIEKPAKRVSWESQEEENSSEYIHHACQDSINNNHKKSLSSVKLSQNCDSNRSSSISKDAYLSQNYNDLASVSNSKPINLQYQNNQQPFENFKQLQCIAPKWNSKRSNSMIVGVTFKDNQQQQPRLQLKNQQGISECDQQTANDFSSGKVNQTTSPILQSLQRQKDNDRRNSLKISSSYSSSLSVPNNSQPNSNSKQFQSLKYDKYQNHQGIENNMINKIENTFDRNGNQKNKSLIDQGYSLKYEDNLRNNYGQKFKEIRRGIKNAAQISTYF